jgi:hypothetical protein
MSIVPESVALDVAAGGNAVAAANTFAGKVVSASKQQLIMELTDGTQQSFVVTNDTKVKLDGKEAQATDLMPGFAAKVTAMDAGDQHIAQSIDAVKADKPGRVRE